LDTLLSLTLIPKEKMLFRDSKAIGLINSEALKREEWDLIIGLSTPLWETYSSWWADGFRRTDSEVRSLLLPLVEALLVKNQDAEADRIFAEFTEKIPSGEIQTQLAQIANKRGKAELSKRWLAM
jgi:hypothetical protein